MISDIEKGIINMVITKDTSRLGRDFIETSQYLFQYFPENKIRYISILENFDTCNPNGVEDIIPFQTVINDMYLKDISRKIKSVRQNKMKQGLYVGSTVPYGYKRDIKDNRRFIIDDNISLVVQKIFNMRYEGKTYSNIAEYLTNEGILPPNVYSNKKIVKTYTTNLWKASTVKNIITNEVYIGNLIQGKYEKVNYKSKKKILLPKDKWIVVENNHMPIIDKELFCQVNDLGIINSKIRVKKYDYLLKGLVICAECGKTMIVRKSYRKNKNSDNSAYYCCKTNVTYRNNICSLHYFNEKKLNNIILEKFRTILSDNFDYKKLERQYEFRVKNISLLEKHEKSFKTINSKILILEKAINDLYIDRASKNITDEEFYKIKLELERDKEKQLLKGKQISQEIDYLKKERYSDRKDKIIENFLNLDNLNKTVWRQLIKRIEINDEKQINIYFNFNLKKEKACV